MKNLTIIFAICIYCISCHKRNDGHLAPNLHSRFTFDSLSFADFNGYSTQSSAFPSTSFAFAPSGKVTFILFIFSDCEGRVLIDNFKMDNRYFSQLMKIALFKTCKKLQQS